MIATGEKRTILLSASASSVFGTATRTISQPALASAAICAVVAGTSFVFLVVIDWTTTGAPPPIWTPPTVTERSLATAPRVPSPGAAEEVVAEAEIHQHREERQPDDAVADVDRLRERAAPHLLHERHHDVA